MCLEFFACSDTPSLMFFTYMRIGAFHESIIINGGSRVGMALLERHLNWSGARRGSELHFIKYLT